MSRKWKIISIILIIFIIIGCFSYENEKGIENEENLESIEYIKNITEKNETSLKNESDKEVLISELLSKPETIKEITNYYKGSRFPIKYSNNYFYLSHDSNSDNIDEIYVLYVETVIAKNSNYYSLSSLNRLYNKSIKPLKFYLVEFEQKNKKLILKNEFYLGKYSVLESFRQKPINLYSSIPFCVSVKFQTLDGSVEKWIIFSEKAQSEFILMKTVNISHEYRDIDNDGIIDLIIYDKVFEEGTGFETFISWYKWNGHKYIQNKSTNIVRNLNHFLDKATLLINKNNYNGLYKHVLSDTDYKNHNLNNPMELFHKIFLSQNSFNKIESIEDLNGLIFPDILENPFNLDMKTHSFMSTVRILGEQDYIYTVKIRMNQNPFLKQQFFFSMNK